MGIKNEEPEDKVIFDSIDNRMKYSKGVKVEQTDPCACHDCVYKENNPYKEPCGTCLSPLNDKNFYVKEGSAVIPNVARREAGLEPKTDNPKNMDDIYNVLNLILEELKNGKKED